MGFTPTERYLELMISTLTDLIYEEEGATTLDGVPFRYDSRLEGGDWPVRGHTMIGVKRLKNIQHCAERILKANIPGDFMETGVWRGGASIFMRALLAVYEIHDKKVWVADSFSGLPRPDPASFPKDAEDRHHEVTALAVSLDEVKKNFAKYGLLDDAVIFVPGWFRDTLPRCEVERLSLLRLDGDMYESTTIALESLYPKLSVGGFVIIDDYGAVPGCRQATEDYRAAHDISEEMVHVDWTGIYWRRTRV